jgi:hypothetical protein
MKLSICTDVMGNLSFTDMLDTCVAWASKASR